MQASSAAVSYGIALALVALAAATKSALPPAVMAERPFLLFYAAVMVAAYVGGLGPGVLATVLAGIAADFLFVRPPLSFADFADRTLADNVQLAMFVAEGAIVSALCEALRRQRRRAEANMTTRSALRIHEHVLESMREGVSVSDEHGVIKYTNAAEDRLFGYTRGELVGKHVTVQNTYPPEENAQRVHDIIAELKRTGVWQGEFSNARKDGTRFISRARITGVDLAGQQHWVCVQEDVSAEKYEAEWNAFLRDATMTWPLCAAAAPTTIPLWEAATGCRCDVTKPCGSS